jgi:cell division septum initiation protein DivIVA
MNDLLIPIAAASGIVFGGLGLIVGKLGTSALRGELEYWLTLNREQSRQIAQLNAKVGECDRAEAKRQAQRVRAARISAAKRTEKAAAKRAERVAKAEARHAEAA